MNARFAATRRQYRYQMILEKQPTLRQYAWNCRCQPDFSLLEQAAAIFPQYTDFGSFCKSNANNKTNICQIYESRWEQWEDRWVYWVSADRFLRGMVRGLVGTMVEIARGRMPLESLHQILKAQDRKAAGPSAPAEGLFLTDVQYPEGSLIPVPMRMGR
jgi:tRNA pseudouridine38-40 synthase